VVAANTSAMTNTTAPQQRRSVSAVLVLLAVPTGVVVAWLTLVASSYLPSDRPSIWFGLPLVAVATVTWLVARRSRWAAVAFGLSGVAALLLFVWLLWQFGQGMENFG
jgi:uncharacterized membrane protein YfcA